MLVEQMWEETLGMHKKIPLRAKAMPCTDNNVFTIYSCRTVSRFTGGGGDDDDDDEAVVVVVVFAMAVYSFQNSEAEAALL